MPDGCTWLFWWAGYSYNFIQFMVAYYLMVVLHEGMHVMAACAVGLHRSALTLNNMRSALLSKHVRVDGISEMPWRAER